MEDIAHCVCPHCGERLRYEVRMISPFEILRKVKGILGVAPAPIKNTYEHELARNRQLLVNFINDMGKEGWEYMGAFNYESIPYKGAIVFRRAVQHTPIENSVDVENFTEKPKDQQKLHEIIKASRKNRKSLVDNDKRIPKPQRTPDAKASNVDEDNKKLMRELFAEQDLKINPDEVPELHKEKWDKIEEDIMIAKENENIKKNLEDLNKQLKKDMKEKGKDVTKEVSVDLVQQFENSHNGQHAVWQGKETIAFKKFKEGYIKRITE